jgi:hypothetical protein
MGGEDLPVPWKTRGVLEERVRFVVAAERSEASVTSLCAALGIRRETLPAEQSRPDIARTRDRWQAHQGRIDPRRVVFIGGKTKGLDHDPRCHRRGSWP